MKKVGLITILMLVSVMFYGETITSTFRISAPEVETNNEYTIVTFDDALLTGPAGCPALPYIAVSIVLPPGEAATSIRFVGENLITIEGNYKLYPYQPSRPLSDQNHYEFRLNNEVYSTSNNYPEVQTGGLSTSFLNGHSIAMSTFTPVVYVPADGKISYYSNVKVIIETAPDPKAEKALDNLVVSNNIVNKISRLVANPNDIGDYSARNRTDDSFDLLIVTTDLFSEGFEGLRSLYLDRGITSEVVTIEYITNFVAGQDLQEKIRNLIIEKYQDNQIEYVILGGDVELVPHRGFYCYVESGTGYTSDNIPADLYYSALDGTWNDDGDANWGEPDEDDLLPEVAIARMPFNTESELNIMIHKSTYYQNSPVLGELNKSLFAGENLYTGPDTWGRDYLDLLIGERSDNGYTTIGIPETNPMDSLYEFHAPWSGSNLMYQINQGKQFVHHVGHASPNYVAHLYSTDITNSNFSGANGIDHNFTLLQTHGCDCGSFDNSDCILEEMVKINNFAVSVIGNSRYGWFNEGQSEGPAAHLHREMVDALYHEKINHLGKAFTESKIQTAPWVEAPGQHEEGALRWNFYDLNILGDPVLSVWTDEPIYLTVIHEDDIEIGTLSTDVNVSSGGSPLENFTCSILKEGVLHSTGTTDVNGDVTLTFNPEVTVPGEAMLIVVGYNSLPDTSYINFIPSGEAYVVYNEHLVNDPDGNNNNLVDFGESILLDLEVINMGMIDADNIIATLTVEDEYVTITDENEQYGNIASGDSSMVENAFAFNVLNTVPNNHIITFELVCESDGMTWTSDFEILVMAPVPQIGIMEIDDSVGGDGNNRLDPGETAILNIQITNAGLSECLTSVVELISDNPYLEITPESIDMEILGAGESAIAEFSVSVDVAAPLGSPLLFDCALDMCGYMDNKQFVAAIGLLIEDFETGDFTAFEWHNGGDGSWVIDDTDPYNGLYCSKSGVIGDEKTSELYITINVMSDDVITFSRKVSSEEGYDFLRHYIDGFKYNEWSGEKDWEVISYDIAAGQHTLLWAYEKDFNSTGGSDCAWLDDIIFPSSATIIGVSESPIVDDFTIYPNPGTGCFYVKSKSNIEDANIIVYNSLGRLVTTRNTDIVSGEMILDLSKFEPGIYTVQIVSDVTKLVRKVVVQ